MSLIVPYPMHEAGTIPGIPGRFAAGQTVFVDVEKFEVVRIEPMGLQPDAPVEESQPDEADSTESQPAPVPPAEIETAITGG